MRFKFYFYFFSSFVAVTVITISFISGCSMSEEMKRIDLVKQAQMRQEATSSGDLTGEQLFIRSCNTCHPGGREGVGPSLIGMGGKLNEDFPNDQNLKAFIRTGKGMMPAQSRQTINDQELDNLVAYLRDLQGELQATTTKKR